MVLEKKSLVCEFNVGIVRKRDWGNERRERKTVKRTWLGSMFMQRYRITPGHENNFRQFGKKISRTSLNFYISKSYATSFTIDSILKQFVYCNKNITQSSGEKAK